jgi:hypothetical protein
VLLKDSSPDGAGRSGRSPSIDAMVSDLIDAPFSGLFSISQYGEGDDLAACLEKPLIIFASSQSQER